MIEVEWDSATEEAFPVKIMIRALDRMGLLADVAASISKGGANILSVNTQTRESSIVDSYFTLAVENLEQLDQVLSGLKKIRQVQEVIRMS
jgi:guanosine-3',5'-bis(diphosphate) 3'-pyrophosphohydrolase